MISYDFIILFSYWFSITTIKNTIATQQKKYNIANPFLSLLIGGVSVVGRRDYGKPPLSIRIASTTPR